jgi:hypothetical protein
MRVAKLLSDEFDHLEASDASPYFVQVLRDELGFAATRERTHHFAPELASGRTDVHSVRNPGTLEPVGSGLILDGTCSVRPGVPKSVTLRAFDSVEALQMVDRISVFAFRRDGPTEGEGSSGIPFLGNTLFQRIVAKLEVGGLVVTDGAGMIGDADQSELWYAPRTDQPVGRKFTAFGREFRCERVLATTSPQTLVWRADPTR